MTKPTPTNSGPGTCPTSSSSAGEIVGAVRIDLIDDVQAGLRLIGIRNGPAAARSRRGAAASRRAGRRDFGRSEVVINAHPTSLQFYLANGYAPGDWRDAGPVHPDLIRVGKELRRRPAESRAAQSARIGTPEMRHTIAPSVLLWTRGSG